MANSIKSRLLLGLILPILAAIIGGSFAVYGLFKDSLYAEMDYFLTQKMRFHQVVVFQKGKTASYNVVPSRWKELRSKENPEYYHLRYSPSGVEITHSRILPPDGLPPIGADSDTPVFENIILPDGKPARAGGVTFIPKENKGDDPTKTLHIVVAENSSRILAALHRLRIILITVGCSAAFLVLFSAFRIVRRNLRPLDDLSQQIEAVPLKAQSSRFTLENAPSELNPVVTRMNALMDRVSLALEKERQFTANAAHELRNPLAAIRSQLELAIAKERSPEEYEKAITSVLKGEKRIERLVDNLLLLSKLEAGQEDVSKVPTSFSKLLRKSWKPCFEMAEQRKLAIKWNVDGSADCDLSIAANLFRIILTNIFQNAVTHSPEKSGIEIAAEYKNGVACVTVCNPAPNLSRDDMDRVFERFWRASNAREQSDGNVGIGLSLCQRIAETLGGTIEATLSDRNEFRIKACIPADEGTQGT